MEENAALRTIRSSIQALGRGFDVNYDTRLLYCKGVGGARVVEVDEEHTKDVLAFEGLVVPGVPRDVSCLPKCQSWQSTGVFTYAEVCFASNFLIVNCSVCSCILLGCSFCKN